MEKVTVYIPINCDNCIRRPACKFLEKYNEVAKSNFMYGMFEYLEWNNLEKIFKSNASSCKHYESSFINGKISFSLVEGVSIMQAINLAFPQNVHSYSSTNPKEKFFVTLRSGERLEYADIESLITITHKKQES